MRKFLPVWLLVFVGIAVVVCVLALSRGVEGATIVVDDDGIPGVDCDYTKIQWAVDNASDGDTILVNSGTYYENVLVDKVLTLKGWDQEDTIIDGEDGISGIIIAANHVNVSGFTVNGSQRWYYSQIPAGIELKNVSRCRIEDNTCLGDKYGIYIYSTDYNHYTYHSIRNNTIRYQFGQGYDHIGINVIRSVYVTLTNNTIDGYMYGIGLSSHSAIIENNTIVNNTYGIYLTSAGHNTIDGNIISNNEWHGIHIYWGSDGNTIKNNTLRDNGHWAIRLYRSEQNAIHGNLMYGPGISFGPYYGDMTSQEISSTNLVNEKPVYYYANMNMNNGSVPPDAGQVILADVSWLKVENITSINGGGISVGYSSHISIRNNNCSFHWSDWIYGIRLFNTDNSTIAGNELYSDGGIFLSESDHNLISNNVGTVSGIGLSRSHFNVIRDNYVSKDESPLSTYGAPLSIYESDGNLVLNNTCHASDGASIKISSFSGSGTRNTTLYSNVMVGGGIIMIPTSESSADGLFVSQDISTNNTVNGRPVYYYKNINMGNASVPADAGQVILGNVSWLRIENFSFERLGAGIQIGFSSHIHIANNSCSNNKYMGIYIHRSHNMTIVDNDFSNVGNPDDYTTWGEGSGIFMTDSDDNLIRGNNCSSCAGNGMWIEYSKRNIIIENNCSNTDVGIYLRLYCNYNTLANNICNNNIVGISALASYHTNVSNNTLIDNTDVGIRTEACYYTTIEYNVCSSPGVAMSSFGGILLWGSNNMIVRGNNCSSAEYGIVVVRGEWSTNEAAHLIEENVIWNNTVCGIQVWDTWNITVARNTCRGNEMGISLHGVTVSTIMDNVCMSNNNAGIKLSDVSILNTLTNNTLSENHYGVYLSSSNNNVLYHNSFILNTNQAYDDDNNTWHGGYPLGGNYWSDYSGTDNLSGPGQDQPGSDGFGDTPYDGILASASHDAYPLMSSPSPVNYPPAITSADVIHVTEDSSYLVEYEAFDPNMDTFVWMLDTDAEWLALDQDTGVLSGIPSNSDVGTFSVAVSVDDGRGGTDWSNFTLVVENAAPMITTTDVTSAEEDAPYSVDYDSTDDGQGSITWILQTDAGFLAMEPFTGLLSGTPDNGDVGIWAVNVTVNDGNGGSDWHEFTMTVLNADPVISTADVTTAYEDSPYEVDYDSNDDGQGIITWSLATDAAWLSIDPATGLLSGIPANQDVGVYWVNVCVDDGNGGADWSNFTLIVENVNDPPVIVSTPNTLATQDAPYGYAVVAEDPDLAHGDTLSYTLVSGPDGMVIDAISGELSWTPTNAQVGEHYVSLSANDYLGAAAVQSFVVEVEDVNNPPVPGVSYHVGIEAYDGEVLEMTISAGGESYERVEAALVKIAVTGARQVVEAQTIIRLPGNPSKQSVSFQAVLDSGTSYELVLDYEPRDGGATPVKTTFSWGGNEVISHHTFKGGEGAQQIVYDVSGIVAEGQDTPRTVRFDASPSWDPDGDIGSYFWDFGDGGEAVGKTVRHEYERLGVYVVELLVTDAGGLSSTLTFEVDITGMAGTGTEQTLTSAYTIVRYVVGGDEGRVTARIVGDPSGVLDTNGLGYAVEYTVTGGELEWAEIAIPYSDAALPEGVEEEDLKLYRWDGSAGRWVAVAGSEVNTEENYVYGNVTYFSIYAAMSVDVTPISIDLPTPAPMLPWPAYLLFLFSGLVVGIVASAFIIGAEWTFLALIGPLAAMATRRVSKEDLELKGMILGMITIHPGVHYRVLKDNTGRSNGTVAYHLRKMENQGLIRSMKDGRLKRYYPVKSRTDVEVEVIKRPLPELIVEVLREHPGASGSEIAYLTEESRQAVYYHLKKLQDEGVIHVTKDAQGHTSCYLNQETGGDFECPTCGIDISSGESPCPNCGREMDWS